MTTKLRKIIGSVLCCALLGACANPYLEEMNWVERDYRTGRISRDEYESRMESLRIRSEAQEAQNRQNTVIAATAIGAAALIGAAAIQADARRDAARTYADSHRYQQRGPSRSGGGSRKSSGGGGGGGGGGQRPPQGGGQQPSGGGPPPR